MRNLLTYGLIAGSILLLSACIFKSKNPLTSFQRQFLLYKIGDQFTMVKNNTDTIRFVVTERRFFESESTSDEYETGLVTFERESLTKSKYFGQIRLDSHEERYHIYFVNRTFANNDSIIYNGYNQYTFLDSLHSIGDTLIRNTLYTNCYLINEDTDTLLFSLDKGIFYIRFHRFNETYRLIE